MAYNKQGVIELAVAYERIRGLERQVESLERALSEACAAPAVVYQGDPAGRSGPGFGLLGQQAMALVEDVDSPAAAPKPAPTVHWFRADGTDPSKPVAEVA